MFITYLVWLLCDRPSSAGVVFCGRLLQTLQGPKKVEEKWDMMAFVNPKWLVPGFSM